MPANTPVKVFFIGNPFGGDDGIGPYLYEALKEVPELSGFELMEMGVIGFDLISYISEEDKVLIVDAVKTENKNEIGKVIVMEEEDLKSDVFLVSQHDFGVEATATMLRRHVPKLEKMHVIGIKVAKTQPFSNQLSAPLMKNITTIKKDVINNIIRLTRKQSASPRVTKKK